MVIQVNAGAACAPDQRVERAIAIRFRSQRELQTGFSYTTEYKARAAIERLSEKPGFKQFPDGFHIFEHTLDRDGWVDGFTVIDDETSGDHRLD